MPDLDLLGGEDDGTVFRDVIMLALLGFVTIVVLLLPHLNPPAAKSAVAEPPGNLTVEVRWPDELDTDVDLWVQAPGDRPVGYANRGGAVFDLLRDDLGHLRDATDLNYEVAYTRGAPAGEYTVNLHLYSNKAGRLPVPVVVVVQLRAADGEAQRLIAKRRVELTRLGEEVTVARFALDDQARLVPGSLHDLPRPLRTARQ